ncbi:uncharacterized protein LOC129569484 [Sitodiplosis mosellana]|uniref:uncharacterized protein LOC129569484 n=1 Tax=Sitodiplosis mosellana TaxID=263140 RepID=UPI002443C776|nr:uncharacterized protein LOC129569484 [Sitodiplosis mosellana]
MSDEAPSKNEKSTSPTPTCDAEKTDDQMVAAAAAVLQIQENPPDIFKLDVDCCEELFEWLSIKDLHSFGQTCKRMHRIAGIYFRQNYPGAKTEFRSDGIYYDSTRLDGFMEFIDDISIETYDSNLLAYIGKCKSLKAINFKFLDKGLKFDMISEVLAKVENIQIIVGELKEKDLELSPNLKRLIVNWSCNAYLLFKLNKCPKLEHINFPPIEGRFKGMERFFEQIPNIQSISIDWRILYANKNGFLQSNAKLDTLIISLRDDEVDETFGSILNELHDRGFYKRLHLLQMDFAGGRQQSIDSFASLRALDGLLIANIETDVIWPLMQNLKTIVIGDFNDFDLTTLPSKLPMLQRIDILLDTTMDVIRAFIRWSKDLKQIRIKSTIEDVETILDLTSLNKERAKLAAASKVIIYVPEDVFLAKKFAGGVSRSFIEIKRFESAKSDLFYS